MKNLIIGYLGCTAVVAIMFFFNGLRIPEESIVGWSIGFVLIIGLKLIITRIIRKSDEEREKVNKEYLEKTNTRTEEVQEKEESETKS